MLSVIAIVPSAPVMVPELAATAATETADLRAAAVSAVEALPRRWVGVGVAATDSVVGPESVGTFAGYGADVRVGLSDSALAARCPPVQLPLCVLITAWLRGLARSAASAHVHTYRSDHELATALALGRKLRMEIERTGDPVGVLIVADGANTLGRSAPGGYVPESIPVQAALDDALAAGDEAALTRLPDSIIGRTPYRILAGLVGSAPRSAVQLYRGAPYGVGYFVGVWRP